MSPSRWLLFLDGDKSYRDVADRVDVGNGFIVAYSIIAFAFYICMVHAIFVITLPPKRREYFGNVLFLLPWTSLVLLLESCSLAAEAAGVERKSLYHRVIAHGWIKFVYVLHATIAPSLLIGTFEVSFLVHKTRFLSFCCLPRQQPEVNNENDLYVSSSASLGDDNHQQFPDQLQHSQQSASGWRNDADQKEPSVIRKYGYLLLRLLIWFSGLLLFALSIIVYFSPPDWPRFLQDDAQNQIGRTGWSALIVSRYNFRLVLSLLPIAIVSCSCLYFSLTLWRYGTTYAIVVHSSWFHPWFLPFYGDIVMMGGQWVGGHTYFALCSRLGILCYLECLNWALQEVSMDIEAAKQFQAFLHVIGTTERIMGHHSVSGGNGMSGSVHRHQQRQQALAAANSTSSSVSPTNYDAPEQDTAPALAEPNITTAFRTLATSRRQPGWRPPRQLEQELVEMSSEVTRV